MYGVIFRNLIYMPRNSYHINCCTRIRILEIKERSEIEIYLYTDNKIKFIHCHYVQILA